MSNIVEQINDAVKTQVSTTLGGTFSELPYTFDVSKNNIRDFVKGFGVRPVNAIRASTVTKVYTADQEFEIILTDKFANRSNDANQKAVVFDLFDKMDDILVQLFLSKGGLAAIIYNIDPFTIDEPEFLDEQNSIVVQRMRITVKYRNAIA